jgi:hypothetical protein
VVPGVRSLRSVRCRPPTSRPQGCARSRRCPPRTREGRAQALRWTAQQVRSQVRASLAKRRRTDDDRGQRVSRAHELDRQRPTGGGRARRMDGRREAQPSPMGVPRPGEGDRLGLERRGAEATVAAGAADPQTGSYRQGVGEGSPRVQGHRGSPTGRRRVRWRVLVRAAQSTCPRGSQRAADLRSPPAPLLSSRSSTVVGRPRVHMCLGRRHAPSTANDSGAPSASFPPTGQFGV